MTRTIRQLTCRVKTLMVQKTSLNRISVYLRLKMKGMHTKNKEI